MGFKKVFSEKKYIKLADQEKGDLLAIGTYRGPTENKFGGINHEFITEDGTVSISAGALNYLLESNNIVEGDLVKVIYDGKIVLDKGAFKGKESHQFEVYVDDSVKVATPKVESAKEEVNESISLDDLD